MQPLGYKSRSVHHWSLRYRRKLATSRQRAVLHLEPHKRIKSVSPEYNISLARRPIVNRRSEYAHSGSKALSDKMCPEPFTSPYRGYSTTQTPRGYCNAHL